MDDIRGRRPQRRGRVPWCGARGRPVRERGAGVAAEEKKKKKPAKIWAVLEAAGLPNWLRKCNAEFYNVKV